MEVSFFLQFGTDPELPDGNQKNDTIEVNTIEVNKDQIHRRAPFGDLGALPNV